MQYIFHTTYSALVAHHSVFASSFDYVVGLRHCHIDTIFVATSASIAFGQPSEHHQSVHQRQQHEQRQIHNTHERAPNRAARSLSVRTPTVGFRWRFRRRIRVVAGQVHSGRVVVNVTVSVAVDETVFEAVGAERLLNDERN